MATRRRKVLVYCLFLEVETSWSWTEDWSAWDWEWSKSWWWSWQMSSFGTETVLVSDISNGVNNAIRSGVSKC